MPIFVECRNIKNISKELLKLIVKPIFLIELNITQHFKNRMTIFKPKNKIIK